MHLLHYGTAPALFAMAMALPLAALGYRFLYLEELPRHATLLLLLLMLLLLLQRLILLLILLG